MTPQVETSSHRWWDSFADAMASLANHRLCLLAVLLALNSIVFPYRGLYHDARLYAVQALNRAEQGTFQDDLFLRYGSQDDYSIFSMMVAPVVQAFGVHIAFFVLYLASKALLLWAALRFLESLTDDRVLSTISVVYFACSRMGYGGLGIFSVNEHFFTPRLVASGLSLLGLSYLLRGRYWHASLWHLLAFLMHPIMGFGSCAVCVIWFAFEKLPRRWFVAAAVLVSLAVSAILAVDSVGMLLFGEVDADWYDAVRTITLSTFPLQWGWLDWTSACISVFVVGVSAVALRTSQPKTSRLLTIVCVVGLTGLVSSVVASERGYKLLFQAQTYRSLWLVSVLQVPSAIFTWACWSRLGPRFGWALGLMLVLLVALTPDLTLVVHFAFFATILILLLMLVSKGSLDLARFVHAGTYGFLAGVVFTGLYGVWVVTTYSDYFLQREGLMWFVMETVGRPGAFVWLVVASVSILWLYRKTRLTPKVAWSVLALAFLFQTAVFVMDWSRTPRGLFPPKAQDLEFATNYFAKRSNSTNRPTIYWAGVRPDAVWFDLQSLCFFEISQVAGVIFSRETALEAWSRAKVVGRFELEYRRKHKPRGSRLLARRWRSLYGVDVEDSKPTLEDLTKLCRQDVDYLILEQKFDGLYSATNDRIYIYQTDRVLEVLDSSRSSRTRPALRASVNRINSSPFVVHPQGVPDRE
ncbi:MAG: hypothetical protein ACFCD0_01795 [Gemmataceae bacterium]